ncbi:MAG: nucleotidyltransferase domain-containing protein [Chloroflexi bacterium]|nr:nucleotidyltransferase domain-containing protein [Chloroflexota bacterium]
MKPVIARFPDITLAYLFGSRVAGQVGPQSDYDFAVLVEADERDFAAPRARLAHELAVALETHRIDVVILNRAPIELAHAVIAQGKLLYQRDDLTRVEYEARIMGLYGDYLPVLRAQRRDIYRGGDHAARVQRYRAALRRTERTLGEIRAAQGRAPR